MRQELGRDPVWRSSGWQRHEAGGRGRAVAPARHTGACPRTGEAGEAARLGPDIVRGGGSLNFIRIPIQTDSNKFKPFQI
jgi:hypothetical protein